MYQSAEKYSYSSDKVKKTPIQNTIIKVILWGFLLFTVTNIFFLKTNQVSSRGMEPALKHNDKVLSSPLVYGILWPFFKDYAFKLKIPERGDIVSVTIPYYKANAFTRFVLNPVFRFLSFQQLSVSQDINKKPAQEMTVKRIIGVPGDTVYLKNFVAYIKPEGNNTFLQEHDLIGSDYTVLTDYNLKDYPADYLFSGNMPAYKLKENEYFLLGDNRPYSSDSRVWGPVTRDLIIAKVILRYWPPEKWGQL